MHLVHMEFLGYNVFAERYSDLTPDQALFIDYGVMQLYSQLFGGDEESKREIDKIKRRRKQF